MIDIIIGIILIAIIVIGFFSFVNFLLISVWSPKGNRNTFLIIPLDSDDNVEFRLRYADLVSKSLGKNGPQIIALDLGISEDGKRIYSYSVDDERNIKLCNKEELLSLIEK